ncbi:MAG: opioid growth factor receptor-related protein [Brevundimonas sp.]|uniref:opioid growth factor receptor-related protein n=1 Tax=Brevundimonas sp. TaxID=1871086 RepID=UPI0040337DD6
MGASGEAVLAFLQGVGADARGRTLFEVLGFSDDALERTHDYIQWLFPLMEASQSVPDAPVLAAADVEAIQGSSMAMVALSAAADRMMAFYSRTNHWMGPADHNHLRITRIIRSLRLLRGEAEADRFRDLILERVKERRAPVSARAKGYWMTA